MENLSSTFAVIRDHDVTFRRKITVGKLAVDDDVSFVFLKIDRKVLCGACFLKIISDKRGKGRRMCEQSAGI